MAKLQKLPNKKALTESAYCKCVYCGQDLPRKVKISYQKQLPDGSVTWIEEEKETIICGCPESVRRSQHMLGR